MESAQLRKDQPLSNGAPEAVWKVMVVDDEPSVHEVTAMVLDDFEFEQRPLKLIAANSAADARNALDSHPDTALILLDVVMESDHAGLDLIQHIREQRGNHQVRIVLRTGQPGQAPEGRVIVDYDINGYTEKTELTSQKLFTTVYSALRSYRDIVTIEQNRNGLERVIASSAYVFGHENSRNFALEVMRQIEQLTQMEHGILFCRPKDGGFDPMAATGEYQRHLPLAGAAPLAENVASLLTRACEYKANQRDDDLFALYFADQAEEDILLYVGQTNAVSEWESGLIELFSSNVSIALENVRLNQEVQATQREIVYLLANAVETRSRETGNHVRRVAKLSALLSRELGLGETNTDMIELAAPLHDVGKIGIPDAILNKAGKLDDDEWVIMRTHAQIGADLLSQSSRPVIKMAAQICRDHHENWDGSGYPDGRAGEQISIAGRIVALADVFDALGSARCYKKPWPASEIKEEILRLRGVKFDPQLVDILLNNWDEAIALRVRYPD